MAGDPDGRGPMASCCRTCSHALLLSNPAGAWVTTRRLTSSNRNIVPLLGAFVDLLRPRDLGVGVEQHLLPLRHPAYGARDREQDREHLDREAHRLVDQA